MARRGLFLAFGMLTLAGAAAPAARAQSEASEMRQLAAAPRDEEPAAAMEEALPLPPPRPGRHGAASAAESVLAFAASAPAGGDAIRALIAAKAELHGVPAPVADAVARIESRYNPRAAHAGNYGLMQIRLQTARGEGYSGSAGGLLDAETNAHFGVKHLARAWRLANGEVCGAIMRYQSGLRATRMSGANRAYCARVKALVGAAASSS